MLFSEDELIAILKKSLPKTDYRSLETVAKQIINRSEHWEEADLNEHIHNDAEKRILEDICKRKTSSSKPPKNIRLFFEK